MHSLYLALAIAAGLVIDDLELSVAIAYSLVFLHLETERRKRRRRCVVAIVTWRQLDSVLRHGAGLRSLRALTAASLYNKRCAWKIRRTTGMLFQYSSEDFRRKPDFLAEHFRRTFRVTIDTFDYLERKLHNHPSLVRQRQAPGLGNQACSQLMSA